MTIASREKKYSKPACLLHALALPQNGQNIISQIRGETIPYPLELETKCNQKVLPFQIIVIKVKMYD